MRIAAPGLSRRRAPAIGPILAALIALVATVAAAYVVYNRVHPSPGPTTQQTARVTRGSIAATVNATGTVASSALSRVNFRGSGTIAEVLVHVGDQVEEGQPLARLDSADLRLAIQQSETRLNVAQIKLRQMLDGPRVEDVEGAQAALAAAQAKLAGMQYGRPEDVAAAQAAVDAATASLQVLLAPQGADLVAAQGAMESAQAQLTSDLAKLQDAQIQAATDQVSARAGVVSGEAELASAQQKLNALLSPQPADVAAAQTAVQTARNTLQCAEGRLNVLLNPSANDVTADRAAVASARGALDAAQRNLAQVKVGPSSVDLASARSALSTAQSALQAAIAKRAADYAAARVPVPTTTSEANAARLSGLTPAESAQLLADDHAVAAAQTNVDSAQTKLVQLQQSPTNEEIAAATAQVDAAQSNFSTAQAKLNALVAPRAEDVASARADADSARAALASAQAKLDQLLSPSADAVAAAQGAVTAAQASLVAARDREAQVAATGASASLAAAQTAVDASTSSVRSAQARLDQLTSPLDSDVLAAQQALQAARAKLDTTSNPATSYDIEAQRDAIAQAQANLDLKRVPYLATDIDAQRATVRQAQTDLETAEFNLDNATLTAPFASVVGAVNMNQGETAAGAAATITGGTTQSGITLVNAAQVRADVQIGETDIPQIAVGQPAVVTFDALPDRRFRGEVGAISPSGTTMQGVVSYLVSITMIDAQDVRPGMTATAAITTAKKDDALMVPNRALTKSGQTRTVKLVTPSGPQSQTVTVGIANDQYSEVLSGLREGDEVVLPATAARAAVPGAGVGAPGGARAPGGGF